MMVALTIVLKEALNVAFQVVFQPDPQFQVDRVAFLVVHPAVSVAEAAVEPSKRIE